jgi:protein-tyrosine phosphatase
MIWHETTSPSVIVMLTQIHESGREKCHPYFPLNPDDPILPLDKQDEFEDGFLGSVTLVSLSEDESARATIRELELRTASGETKKVWHLLFGGWPDFLVPEGDDRVALLKLLALSNEKNANDPSNPRIVHCSAGVGRSGSFIALDWLLQELEEGSLDDLPADRDPIAEVVDQLRQQRMMMVQGEAQFGFLYEVLREKWRDRWWKLHPEGRGAEALECVKPEESDSCKHQNKKAKSDSDKEEEALYAELEAELSSAGGNFEAS